MTDILVLGQSMIHTAHSGLISVKPVSVPQDEDRHHRLGYIDIAKQRRLSLPADGQALCRSFR